MFFKVTRLFCIKNKLSFKLLVPNPRDCFSCSLNSLPHTVFYNSTDCVYTECFHGQWSWVWPGTGRGGGLQRSATSCHRVYWWRWQMVYYAVPRSCRLDLFTQTLLINRSDHRPWLSHNNVQTFILRIWTRYCNLQTWIEKVGVFISVSGGCYCPLILQQNPVYTVC